METISTSKIGNYYTGTFASGKCVLRVSRSKGGYFAIKARVTGHDDVVVRDWSDCPAEFIFNINIPDGMTLVAESESQITKMSKI